MYDVSVCREGNYRFIPAMMQYSGGVAALAGYRIERARLSRPLPLSEGFRAIKKHLAGAGRPNQALCACELRSPAPFSEDGFASFNRDYASRLQELGIMRDGINPVARTNVCPEVDPPAEVLLYAFSYTVPDPDRTRPSFVVAGSGEAPEGKGNYRDHAIRLGDRTADGILAKARWVLGEMERRLAALEATWADATGTHVYTVFDIHPFLADQLAGRGAMPKGLTWHFARPPVADLDYEMDLRGVSHELVI
jgi:hypothetical protein